MTDTDRMFDDYRARLRLASADLPVGARDELLDDVEAHLADVRADVSSPAAVRDALDRLGAPEEIVAAARAELPTPPPSDGTMLPPGGEARGPAAPSTRPGRVRGLDVAAVVLLLIGGLFPPVLGWVVGVVLLWASATWTWREKLLGTLVVPGGLAAPFFLASFPTASCTQGSTTGPDGVTVMGPEVCSGFVLPLGLGAAVLVALVIAPVVTTVVLLRRARARS